MDQAILQALHSLLPEQNANIPQELVGLANALLAQSRVQASSLKSDEEIARLYACAHLASSRLRRPLGLSKLVVRPPCLPKTYQSLYRHFDGILQAGTKRRGRPSTLHSEPSARVTLYSEDSYKPTTSSTLNNSSRETGSALIASQLLSSLPAKDSDPTSQNLRLPLDIPDWATTIIHKTCRVTGATLAPSHVFAGLGVALETFSQPPLTLIDQRLPIDQAQIFPLILAIHLSVSLRLSGEHVSGEAFDNMARRTLQAAKELEFRDKDWQDVQLKMIHAWIAGFQKQRFLEMEWYHNIPKCGAINHKPNQTNIIDEPKINIHSFKYDGIEQSNQHTLRPGLGTMMQDKVNFLSQAKRAEYFIWKHSIMIRLEEMEKAENASRPI